MAQIIRQYSAFAFLFAILVLLSFYAAADDVTDCASGQIGVSGTYALVNDITADADPCIYITVSDVVIDGGGHTLSGPGGFLYGIAIDGTAGSINNVTISNFNITGFDWYPIYVYLSTNVTINNNNITSSPSFDSISLQQATESVVEYNRLSVGGSSRGIGLTNSVNVSVRYNNITSTNSFGLWLFSADSQDNLIEGNRITSTNSFSIVAWTAPNNRFVNNLVNSPNGQDIRIYSGSTGTTFTSLIINNSINISFTQDGGTAIGDAAPITPPAGLAVIGTGKYLNITNYTDAWMYLNISYNDNELAWINESSLKIWRWNGANWNDTGFANIAGVNTTANYVYARISNFSVFAVFGEQIMPNVNISINATNATAIVNTNASYLVTIGNNGTVAGTYNLTVQNLTVSPSVMTLNQSNITLAIGSIGSVLLNIGNNATGEFNVSVTALLSTNASINTTTAVITTRIQPAAACGNNIKETGETCDGSDLAGKSCADFSRTGTLRCLSDCSDFDISGCSSTSGGGSLPPIISLLSPESAVEGLVKFEANVKSYARINSCNLLLDNKIAANISNVSSGRIYFNLTLGLGNYTWTISCKDIYGRIGTGDLMHLNVSAVSAENMPAIMLTCTNGIKDGNEIGVDCGGECEPCESSEVSKISEQLPILSRINLPNYIAIPAAGVIAVAVLIGLRILFRIARKNSRFRRRR